MQYISNIVTFLMPHPSNSEILTGHDALLLQVIEEDGNTIDDLRYSIRLMIRVHVTKERFDTCKYTHNVISGFRYRLVFFAGYRCSVYQLNVSQWQGHGVHKWGYRGVPLARFAEQVK